MKSPKEWDGRTVTVKIYPIDQGFSKSYALCFERCSGDYAEKTPFIIYTAPGRFSGYRGDKPVVVTAKYHSTCFYRYTYSCPENHPGQFEETTGSQ